MSNFGIFRMPALQIWPCHVTQEANFEKILFFPNSAFNIGKSCKISSRKALNFRSYQPETSRGGGGGGKHPPPVLLLLRIKKLQAKQIGGGKQPSVLIVLNNEKTRFTGMKLVDA